MTNNSRSSNNHIENFVKNTLMQLKKCIQSTSKRP